MGSLNKQISDSYVQMNNILATRNGYQAETEYGPLELKDTFNNLCDELSQYMNISVTQQTDGTYDVSFGDVTLVHKDQYAKTDIIFSGDQTERNDFAELHISSLNTEKGWTKSEREITSAIQSDPELSEKVDMLNSYIYQGNVKVACDLEKEIIADAKAAGIEYSPIFTNNMTAEQMENAPSYAITVAEETDQLTGGSVSGLFDMYNGKGCYAEGAENTYNGIKYYQETIRSFANTLVKQFNSLYDEYNNSDTAVKQQNAAADKAEEALRADTTAQYMADNGITDETALTDDDKAAIEDIVNETLDDVRSKAIEDTKFKLFEFQDGALEDGEVSNLKIADTWSTNVLRCVHPNVDDDGNIEYNYDALDNTYVNKILSAFDGKYKFGNEPDKYTFEEFIQFYGQTIGGDREYELGNYDSTSIMLNSVSSARDEVMGVSMDEEGVNMMNYQKWYNAISRMITALDECLDKLINGTGTVGL
jgi:flagellar hook-associated protein FlgK